MGSVNYRSKVFARDWTRREGRRRRRTEGSRFHFLDSQTSVVKPRGFYRVLRSDKRARKRCWRRGRRRTFAEPF
jgi:hypothetical protein